MNTKTNKSGMSELTDDELDAVSGGRPIADYTNALTSVVANAFAFRPDPGQCSPMAFRMYGDMC